MNFTASSIEGLLETPIDQLEQMSDADLDKFFEEVLKIKPNVDNIEPVGDAPMTQIDLSGSGKGSWSKARGASKPKVGFTLAPQSEMAKNLGKQDKISLAAEMLKELDDLL